jgi:hypothetical protein
LTVCLLAWPAIAWGQYAPPADHSIIRQTGYGWRNQVIVPDGQCGCDMPVRADCYDQPCCFRCGLRPLCFLQRVHRMLDCLLPCHKCGCGPFGGCLLGGRCGGCGGCGSCCCTACCGGGCGCSSGLPGFSDPFLDDPLPPKPVADPGTEVRYQPAPPRRLTPAPRATPTAKAAPSTHSPWKVTGSPPTRQAAPRTDLQASQRPNDLRVVIQPAAPRPKPATQSVLRRTSAEEPAPLPIEMEARPIIRSQTPDETSDYAIPFNPLRGR